MRELKFKTFPIGSRGVWMRGTVVELLKALPHLQLVIPGTAFPSRDKLNDLLLSGKDDAGMSGACEWKPFSISEEEYQEIHLEMITMPGSEFYISDSDSKNAY